MRCAALVTSVLALATLATAGPAQVASQSPTTPAALSDGPHLFHQADGSVLARWVTEGKVAEQRFAKGDAIALPRFQGFLGERLQLRTHRPDPAIFKQPKRMLVVSDVEGEYAVLRAFLRANGVIDDGGTWAFGDGHLVCVGDMVDRGTAVTETMWLLYRLAGEAHAAGGHLHYVIGNHEVMMMGGDVRYTAKKYHDVARLFGIATEGLVGADTEIGRWWRSFNTMTRIGPYLFVHAGVAPALAPRKLDLDRFNTAMRSVFGTPPVKITDRYLQAVAWGRLGPLWYRGYFKDWAPEFGPTPTTAAIDKLLGNLGAETIVIGHTKVKQIAPLFGGRRVLPIDIPWTDADKVRGLLIRGDAVEVVDIKGRRSPLASATDR